MGFHLLLLAFWIHPYFLILQVRHSASHQLPQYLLLVRQPSFQPQCHLLPWLPHSSPHRSRHSPFLPFHRLSWLPFLHQLPTQLIFPLLLVYLSFKHFLIGKPPSYHCWVAAIPILEELLLVLAIMLLPILQISILVVIQWFQLLVCLPPKAQHARSLLQVRLIQADQPSPLQ